MLLQKIKQGNQSRNVLFTIFKKKKLMNVNIFVQTEKGTCD